MAIMEAFLDDFGSVSVTVSRAFYNGHTEGFYLTNETGYCKDCLVRGVEERESDVKYALTIPAEFEIGRSYRMHEQHGQTAPLKIRFIVRTRQFDRLYSYDGDDLGSTYSKEYTLFALWAPTASSVLLKLVDQNKTRAIAMTRYEKGVWRCRADGDLKHALYTYLVERNGEVKETLDPYGLSSNANAAQSAVIDTAEILKIADHGAQTPFLKATDAVIYECSIRDMTSSRMTSSSTNGKFMSLAQEHTSWKGQPTGLDYLCSLGITHVQFQPVTDFETVDELHPERGYNWGYDPQQLTALEGSYSSDPDDPYARMKELRTLVSVLHAHDIRVNLDVVFNHMYDVNRSSFDCTVPYYYFRYNDSGYLSNGSFCGNDLDSSRAMVRQYFLKAIRTLSTLYGIDGYRFDLMGILDLNTMNQIAAEARRIKPETMIYGEGWNMPTCLPDDQKATIENQHQMPQIGFFNDTFRDILKGRTSEDQRYDRGYLTGSLEMAHEMCSEMAGNILSDPYYKRFDNPAQSINALETHDNATIWDKMHACCADEPREKRQMRQKMMLACTLLAQGVPFLHQGEEFCGTKKDNGNSYSAGDGINSMNWDRMFMNADIVEYTRRCIALRRNHPAFRISDPHEMYQRIHFTITEGNLVLYEIASSSQKDPESFRVIINPSDESRDFPFQDSWEILLDEKGETQPASALIHSPSCSVIVCRKKEAQ